MIPGIKGLHIEPTNICVLKCPGCARTRFIDKWPQHWKNHCLDPDALLRFLDIELRDLTITLCGNYGDPIYHPDFFDFTKKFKERGAKLVIITNGSHRKSEWWQELVSGLDSQDDVMFSIDGVPDTFTQYRINADWPSLVAAIDVCARSTVRTTWKFIPFAFNQDSIDAARRLSEDLGVDRFMIDPSARFDERTEVFLPTEKLVSPLKTMQDDFKKGVPKEVDPLCYLGNQHFISADGFYSPCCFVADHRFYYKTIFAKQRDAFDIREHRLSDVLTGSCTTDFFGNLATDPAPVCQFSCPKCGS